MGVRSFVLYADGSTPSCVRSTIEYFYRMYVCMYVCIHTYIHTYIHARSIGRVVLNNCDTMNERANTCVSGTHLNN